MICNFVLTKFETRAERPLFTGDAAAYRLTVPLPVEGNGLLTVAAYRPDTENPVLVSEAFSGTVASATLAAGQYDKEGETRFLCTVSDGDGGILTTRVLYATVLRGIADGTPAADDKTALSSLLSEAGKAVSECSAAASSATEAATAANTAAQAANTAATAATNAAKNIPTKVSQLENDSKFIENLSEYPEQQIYLGPMSFLLGTISTTLSARVFSVTDSLNNEYISVLENESGQGIGSLTLKYLATPTADTSAATKKYVDDTVTAAITTALNTAV